MTKSDRQSEILAFLQNRACANVQEICQALYVSPATVRRDLRALEAMRQVRLFHGGVALMQPDEKDVPLSVRENDGQQKKIAIARRAAGMLPAGASVMLDASSTALYVAGMLDPANNNTVFTNCLRTAGVLSERRINAYCIGGAIKYLSLSTTGALARANVEMLQVDYLLFSSQGLAMDGAITDNAEEETLLRQLMLRHARHSYFLCDSNKLGRQRTFFLCNAAQTDGVISDADLSEIPDINWISI